MQPVPLNCNWIQWIQQVCCHRMPHFESLEVMDRLHNIQSPDYIQQPELLCLAGARGSTFRRVLLVCATCHIWQISSNPVSLFTSVELVLTSFTEAFLALLVSFPFMMLFDIVLPASATCELIGT